jgi:flotillin
MTVNPMCDQVETAQGVPLTVTGVAQIKVMRAEDLLRTAAEQFLGVPVNQLRATVNQTLEGHLRAILGEFNSTFGKNEKLTVQLTDFN